MQARSRLDPLLLRRSEGARDALARRWEQRQMTESRVTSLGFDYALLRDGWAADVVIDVDEAGLIVDLESGVDQQRSKERKAPDRDSGGQCHWTHGVAVPGMANVHSHAHQRLMAGLAERSGPGKDSFWTWREAMYRFAGTLTPDQMEVVAAQAYVEMLEAGFTAVGEFQYLHNQPDGSRYAEPAEMSLRCLAAARQAGIGITLLPVLYSRGGFDGRPLEGGQKRFATEVNELLAMVEVLRSAIGGAGVAERFRERVGVAPHSLRAVSSAALVELCRAMQCIDANMGDASATAPIHLHIAEQQLEVDECVARHGSRPVAWLVEQLRQADCPLDERWCLIHATHLDNAEVADLASSGAVVGLCPTTEANLGDGTFRAKDFLAASGAGATGTIGSTGATGPNGATDQIAIGTDSQVRISVAEDLRQLETSQRLRDHARNVLALAPDCSTGRTMFDACSAGGAKALAQPMGKIAKGMRADFVVLDPTHPRLLGRSEDAILDSWIFAGDNSCVSKVYVGGRCMVSGGRHKHAQRVADDYRKVLRDLGQSGP